MTRQDDSPVPSRRSMLQIAGSGVIALGVASLAGGAAAAQAQTADGWDKVFPRSDRVDHRKVSFPNRFGITLVGDLYVPKGSAGQALPGLAVCGPFGAVKEQSSGLYAQTMAERGFATLAFDASYTGESGGQPRNIASPDINTEDVMAAVDYLGLLPEVDRDRIGLIGICGFGGMALGAAAVDKRIKAVVASTMYDMSRNAARGRTDNMTLDERTAQLQRLSLQRWDDAARGAPAYRPPANQLRGGDSQVSLDFHDYYMTPRGYHPRAVNSGNAWSQSTAFSFMNFPQLTYIAEISPRPVLIVHGEAAHSLYFSRTAYEQAAEPKELLLVPGASHVDLYDQVDIIPFDRLTTFFRETLFTA